MKTPNQRNKRPALGLAEIMACVFIMAIAFLPLFNLQRGSDQSIVKAGEFMVSAAVLHNTVQRYKILPFDLIETASLAFDESGNEARAGKTAFLVRVRVELVAMPNNWSAYKRIFLEVEKPGLFFGTTLLKTVLLRVTWISEP